MLTIPYLDTNPIAIVEYLRLRRSNHMTASQQVWFALLYWVIIVIAFSPYIYYITPDRVWWLGVMALVVFGFQFYVTLRAASIVSVAPLPNMELMHILPIGRWQLILGKWWAIFKAIWAWYLLAAIPKVGVSLGVMGYMHLEYLSSMPFLRSSLALVATPYVSTSYASYQGHLYPMGWLVVLVFTVSVSLSLLDGAMLAAMAVFAGSLSRKAILSRLLIVKAVTVVMFLALAFLLGYSQRWQSILLYRHHRGYGCLGNSCFITYRHIRGAKHLTHAQIAALGTFVDGGVMLNSALLQPGGMGTHQSECFWFGACPFNLSVSRRRRSMYYLIRHLLSVAYGMFLHIALTLGFLVLAARRHP